MKTSKRLWFVYSNKTCKFFFYRNPEDLLPLGEIDIKLASFYFDPRYCSQGMFEIRYFLAIIILILFCSSHCITIEIF